ncbi:unnamed protein product [Owenia fusiformis]|uniref:C2H2-type domain-containing protein n=1 Tax=Owenia fusiformis TaxID=6347 RepID=A0A8S4Q7S2_OWEFU|nr:unnamed protein product [Owenia fusiformis]
MVLHVKLSYKKSTVHNCPKCTFSTRNKPVFDRHRQRCSHSNNNVYKALIAENNPGRDTMNVVQTTARKTFKNRSKVNQIGAKLVQKAISPKKQKALHTRNYKCPDCKFHTLKSKAYLFHQVKLHGAAFQHIVGCTLCDYASRWKCKIERHQALKHKGAGTSKTLWNSSMDVDLCSLSPSSSNAENIDVPLAQNGGRRRKPATVMRVVNNPDSDEDHEVSFPNLKEDSGEKKKPESAIFEDLSIPGQSKFKCKLCHLTSHQQLIIERHYHSRHNSTKQLQCTKCDYTTSSKVDFFAHKAKHSSENSMHLQCKQSSFGTSSQSDVTQHMMSHRDVSLLRCQLCEYVTEDSAHLNDHVEMFHLEPEDEEGTAVITAEQMEKAMEKTYYETHDTNKPKYTALLAENDHVCKLCGYDARCNANLKIHMVTHSNERGFPCKLCHHKYKRASDLNRHMKKNHGLTLSDLRKTPLSDIQTSSKPSSPNPPTILISDDQPLNLSVKPIKMPRLDIQPRSESKMAALPPAVENIYDPEQPLDLSVKSEPMEIESIGGLEPMNLNCNSCSYIAKWPSDLRRHMLVHSIEKRFQCPYCDKRYKYPTDMNVHIKRTHKKPGLQYSERAPCVNRSKPTPAGDYRCQLCDFQTTFKSALDRHYRIHTGEKPFHCTFCIYASSWRGDLKRHLEKHHMEKLRELDINSLLDPVTPSNMSEVNYHTGESEAEQHQQSPSQNTDDEKPATAQAPPVFPGDPYLPSKTHTAKTEPSDWQDTSSEASWSTSEKPETTQNEKGIKCPRCPFIAPAQSKLDCHLAGHENLKRYKCLICGRRSNWSWDIRKHIKRDHPTELETQFTHLTMEEAQNTIGDYLKNHPFGKVSPVRLRHAKIPQVTPARTKGNALPSPKTVGYIKPYKCSECGRRSNWKWDINKHIRAAHYGTEAHVIIMSVEDAKTQPIPPISTKRQITSPATKYDPNNLKPFQCGGCPYRSNWRSDIARHLRRSHDLDTSHIIVLDAQTASSTLEDYNNMFAGKKFSEKRITSSEHLRGTPNNTPPPTREGTPSPFSREGTPYSQEGSVYSNPPDITGQDLDDTTDDSNGAVNLSKVSMMSPNLPNSGENISPSLPANAQQHFDEHIDNALKKEENQPMDFTSTASNTKQMNIHEGAQMDTFIPFSDIQKSQTSGGVKRKVWRCSKCDYRSHNKVDVMKHLQIHAKDKAYKCKLCTYSSNFRSAVYRHLRSKHQANNYDQMMDFDETLQQNENEVEEITEEQHLSQLQTSQNSISQMDHDSTNLVIDCAASFDDEKRHHCTICPYKTTKPGMLQLHMSYHKPSPQNMFKCSYCPYYVSVKRLLHQHTKLHMEDGTIDDDAHIPPSHQTALDLATKHDDDNDDMDEPVNNGDGFQCTDCPYITRSKNDIAYHRQFHSPNPSAPFKCNNCDYWVTMKRLLVQHGKVHSEEYQLRVKALKNALNKPTDPAALESIEMAKLKQTIINAKVAPISLPPDISPMDDPYKASSSLMSKLHRCAICPYISLNHTNLILHERAHGQHKEDGSKFGCPFCDFATGNKTMLAVHIKVHSNHYKAGSINDVEDLEGKGAISENRAVSPKATVVFSDPAISPTRELLDSGGFYFKVDETTGDTHLNKANFKKFVCEKCPYATSKKLYYERHLSLHGSKLRFGCEFCDYSTPTFSQLQTHKSIHLTPNGNLLAAQSVSNLLTQPEIPADIAATEVNMSDKTVKDGSLHDNLELYENSESFEEPNARLYRCNYCPYNSQRRDGLISHEKFHISRGTFKCPHCSFSVNQQHLLNQHINIHFSNPSLDARAEQVENSEPTNDETTPEFIDINDIPVEERKRWQHDESKSMMPKGESVPTTSNAKHWPLGVHKSLWNTRKLTRINKCQEVMP